MPVTSNINQVIVDLKRVAADFDKKSVQIVGISSLEMFRQLISLSPVDTGYYRATHDLTINNKSSFKQPADEALFNQGSRGGGAEEAQFQEAESRLGSITGRDISKGLSVFFTNNAPYSQPLEDGHSLQAAQGIYTIVSKKAPAIIKAAVKAVT